MSGETFEEFLERVGADEPFSPELDAKVRSRFAAPLPPAPLAESEAVAS